MNSIDGSAHIFIQKQQDVNPFTIYLVEVHVEQYFF